jgi:hypothetical protein
MAVWFVAFSPLALLGGYLLCQADRLGIARLAVVPLAAGALAAGTAAAAVRLGK